MRFQTVIWQFYLDYSRKFAADLFGDVLEFEDSTFWRLCLGVLGSRALVGERHSLCKLQDKFVRNAAGRVWISTSESISGQAERLQGGFIEWRYRFRVTSRPPYGSTGRPLACQTLTRCVAARRFISQQATSSRVIPAASQRGKSEYLSNFSSSSFLRAFARRGSTLYPHLINRLSDIDKERAQ